MSRKGGEIDKGGRPALEFSEDELRAVEAMASMNATLEEIARYLECSKGTVQNRLKNDERFMAAYNKGESQKRISLKRMMWQAAKNGNITMQIFLSKQPSLLGYTDRSDIAVHRAFPDVIAVPVGGFIGEGEAVDADGSGETKATEEPEP